MRTRTTILAVVAMLTTLSCHRNKNSNTEPCCATSYYSTTDIPYDTSSTPGIFIYEFLSDSSAGSATPTQAAYTAIIPLLTNTAQVTVNGTSLIQVGNKFSTALRSVDLLSPGVPPEGAWAVKSNDSFSFAYANTDTFPGINIRLDDTITNGINNTFYFDADNVMHADTMLLKIYAPADAGGFNVLSWYGSPTDKIQIPDDVLTALKGKLIRYSISAFNHRFHTVSSYDCIFIKQYTRSGYSWFR